MNMKRIVVGIVLALSGQALVGQTARHVPQGIVSDWTHQHVLYPESEDSSVMARIRRDPRWMQNWYLRHGEAWWPEYRRGHGNGSRRDWSVALSAAPSTSAFEPLFDFTFDIPPETGYGSLNTTDINNGQFLATAGSLTVTGGADIGTYPLYPGGPGVTVSPFGSFDYDNILYPSIDPPLDLDGLLFTGPGLEINIWGNSPGNYSYYDSTGGGNYGTTLNENGTFPLIAAPGGGQTGPSKYVFDVNAAPSCTNDFAVIGIPTNPASGGQGNIVGFNNLYSTQGGSVLPPFCGTNGPTVVFAYASGTGQVPAPVVISQNGSQISYIENLPTGSSYFHVLTIGTTGTNGTSATAAVAPGSAGGNNAVDQRVLLSPDGGITNQSSTNIGFVVYTPNDANDVAYATTYSIAGAGSGYLYKIANVFNGSATPTIVWSTPITAVPSTPVYDSVSNNIFFTDSNGRIDYVTDNGVSPSPVFYGPVLASGNTAENPVIVDSTNEMVYATFNSNGTNAIVVQAPTSLASAVSVAVGAATGIYTSPYKPDFNNDWYTGTGTPVMYVAGTGTTGTLPTLYSIGFDSSGVLNSSANATTAALATGTADSSWLTAFYNASLQKDYLFVGVTNNCVATIEGGNAGCVMSLDITNGFPTVDASSTALAAPGGTGDIIVDNDSTLTGASSIYYVSKSGVTLVKATQSGLN
ncbi:MAG: hypothetical protein ABR874_19980 [Candidatus Sulfotelmatobacter sp.]|jgi:hypothetical protein